MLKVKNASHKWTVRCLGARTHYSTTEDANEEDGAAATGRAGEEHYVFFFSSREENATFPSGTYPSRCWEAVCRLSAAVYFADSSCPSLDCLLLPSNGFFEKSAASRVAFSQADVYGVSGVS